MAEIPGTRRPPWVAPKRPQKNQGRSEVDMTFYNSKAWKRARKRQIEAYPLCEISGRFNRVVEAEVVDHIIPINAGGSGTDPRNLMSLTKAIHDLKSAHENHHGVLVPVMQTDTGLVPYQRKVHIYRYMVKLLEKKMWGGGG